MVEVAFEDGVTDSRLTLPGGRVIAWTEHGLADGTPMLRLPGTPGCRWSLGAGDRSRFTRRGLRVITTERPGMGASTRLPGRGFNEHADDLAVLLDHLGIESAYITGGSGGAPYVLAFIARHGDRAKAATIQVGAAPLEESDTIGMVEINRRGWELARAGDRDAMREFMLPFYEAMVADPVAGLRAAIADASDDDRAAMEDEEWQAGIAKGIFEALNGNLEGWIDEAIANELGWDDIDFDAITTSVTWWHGRTDALSPIVAVERLIARIPGAVLRELDGEGHIGSGHDEEILDELLARG
ncbi:MAG TPA: alpha/beta hydrolase [Acidimicrobiales bacterium]